MKLSTNFTLDELSASTTAVRLGIDNTPGPVIVDHLIVLAQGLEQVRALLRAPLRINSGYRCKALNVAVKGAKASAHMDGYAADFTCAAFGTPLAIVKAIAASGIPFDKCIQEGTWVHISFDPKQRGLLLTAHFGPGGTTYTQGVSA